MKMPRRGCIALGLGTVLIGLIIAAAFGLHFGKQWLVRGDWSGPPQVHFRQPSSGQEVGLNDEVPIFVGFSPPERVTRLELWIDGELTEQRDLAEGKEGFPSEVLFTWRPREAGGHVLLARAVAQAGMIGTSRPLILKVTDAKDEPWLVSVTMQAGDTLESIAGNLGVTPDEIRAANPDAGDSPPPGTGLTIPLPRASLPAGYVGDDARGPAPASPDEMPERATSLGGEGEAEAIEVSEASPRALPNGLVWDLGAPSLPTAPAQLALTEAEDCIVEVRFSDDSSSESGFRLYRWGPASSDFVPVAELGPNRAAATLLFRDQVPYPGLHLYYVAAANGWGEALGPIRPVEVSPEDCIPEQTAQADQPFPLKLEVLDLTTTPAGSLDSAYCYLSLAFLGASHLRLPTAEDAFFTRDGESWNVANYAAGSNRFAFRQPVDESIPFGMECWGWAGSDLVDLGSFNVEISPEVWLADLPQDFTDEGMGPDGSGFRVTYRISLFLPEGLEFVPVDSCPAPCYYMIPAPYDLDIPRTVDECIEGHVGLAGGDVGEGAVAAEWACLELDPNQMLTWEWDETAGIPRSLTQSFEVQTFTSEYAYRHNEPETPIDVIGSAAQVIPRRMPPCGRTYLYDVTTYVYIQRANGMSDEGRSRRSDAIAIAGPACPEYAATLELQLDSLHIEDSSDVDGVEALCWFCDEDVTQEAYGLLRVAVAHGGGPEEDVGRIILWDDVCGTVGGLEPCGEHTRSIHDGDYDLTQETMASCNLSGGSWDCSSYEGNRSRVSLTVYDGDEIWVYLTLMDHDTGTGDDVFCSGSHPTGPVHMDADQWEEGSQSQWGIYDENSEATCNFVMDAEVIARYRSSEP